MNADGRVNERILAGQPDAGFEIGRAVAGADGQDALDSGRAGALDRGGTVRVKFLVVQMAVRIDDRHFNRAPTGISSRKLASTGLPPSIDAATIMPFEVSPRNLRGCRFATITTLRPTSASGV